MKKKATAPDYRFAAPPPVMLGVQWGLPGFDTILTVVYQGPPAVYRCVCGEWSDTPLPRCQECAAVMCRDCQRVENSAVCRTCVLSWL